MTLGEASSHRQGQVRRDLPEGGRDPSRPRCASRCRCSRRRPSSTRVTNQGCADRGLVLPAAAARGGGEPRRVRRRRHGASARSAGLTANGTLAAGVARGPRPPAPVPSPSVERSLDRRVDAALRSGRFWPVVGVFFVAGVLLSFTPCVLPMLPILSSLIAGQGAERVAPARLHARGELLARHGARLHRLRRRRRSGRRRPRRGAADALGAGPVRDRPARARGVDVRLLRTAVARTRCTATCTAPATRCPPAACSACSRWAASRR